MKLSVLIITYNQSRYIRQAVESALMQKTDFQYEIVIGEDGSSDHTRAILQQLDREHPGRLRLLFRNANIGMMQNFTQTLDACRGEYVALLEGDDYWTDTAKLQTQIDQLRKYPSWCSASTLSSTGTKTAGRRTFTPRVSSRSRTLDDLLVGVNFVQTCSLVFRRAALGRLPDWFQSVGCG